MRAVTALSLITCYTAFLRKLQVSSTPQLTAAPATRFSCWIDGSFSPPQNGGTGYILLEDGVLIQYEGQGYTQALAAVHMEGLSLWKAMRAVLIRGITQCTFYTDSLVLWQSISSPKTPVLIQWQVYNEIILIWQLLEQYPDHFVCRHVQRESNQQADHIANQARIFQFRYMGYTFPLFAH